jgi:hypothetical protein
VYWRAVYNGMAPEDSDGEENDPHEYFRKVDFEYLGSEHSKGVSSKRSELAGMRGVWQVFETCRPSLTGRKPGPKSSWRSRRL